MRIKNPSLLRGLIHEIDGSQRAFAAHAGIHSSTLTNILAGRRTTSRATAERICQRAQVELDRVFIADEPATAA